jgi:Domain of unknown function (DUF4352)
MRLSLRSFIIALLSTLPPVLFSTGCTRVNSNHLDFQMGERINVGPLTYNVIESSWQNQLGSEFKMRIPDQRYLLITVSVTNGGGRDVSVPLLTLEGQNGTTYTEVDNGEGVPQWFGLLRTLNPAQTEQGRLLFDVPLGSYRLKVTDGGDPGVEKSAWVSIPLHMDPAEASPTPLDPPTAK